MPPRAAEVMRNCTSGGEARTSNQRTGPDRTFTPSSSYDFFHRRQQEQ
jgi:hypothetical protein